MSHLVFTDLSDGRSRESLAVKVKVHRTTMSEIERGITNISVDIDERIANALDVTLRQLFRGIVSHKK